MYLEKWCIACLETKKMPSKEVIKFLCLLPSHLNFCIHQAPEEILAARILILIGELSRVYKY